MLSLALTICRHKGCGREIFKTGGMGLMKTHSEIMRTVKKLANCDNGASAIEYALIAAATGLALASSLPSVEAGLSTVYTKIMNFF